MASSTCFYGASQGSFLGTLLLLIFINYSPKYSLFVTILFSELIMSKKALGQPMKMLTTNLTKFIIVFD